MSKSENGAENATANPNEEAANIVFRMENILVKNLSLEMPKQTVTPAFKEDPTIKMELRNSARPLSRQHYYEVTLDATFRLQSGEDVQLLIETTHAGIVYVENATPLRREELLNIHAPEMLYPYASQTMSDLMIRAGAPRVFLPPFNFRALYEQRREALELKMANEPTDKAAS